VIPDEANLINQCAYRIAVINQCTYSRAVINQCAYSIAVINQCACLYTRVSIRMYLYACLYTHAVDAPLPVRLSASRVYPVYKTPAAPLYEYSA
jgi:hypothetical protein